NDIDHKCEAQLRDQFTSLKDKFTHLLQDVIEDTMQIAGIRDGYFESLPALYSLLLKDAEALLQSDPAAQSLEEVMAAYPGFYATAVHRLAHELYEHKVPVIPRLFSEYADGKTGTDIHLGATIGQSLRSYHAS